MSTLPRSERWAFFDCFAGISGDMTLGALIDLGLPMEELQGLLPALGLAGVSLTARRVTKQHLTGVKVEIEAGAHQPARTCNEICALIQAAPLTEAVKTRSLSMFRLLGEVEARIHGQPLETVHFHELGGLDTIVDVVGAAHGLGYLGVSRVFCSPLPMGWGMIAAGHGRLPNPAPATLELLQGLPVYGTDLPGELVTPTGAVILKACEARCEPCPPMTLTAVGYGAGSRDLPGHPNLLRLFLGTPLAPAPGLREQVLVLETHLDDMNPEWYEPLIAGLLAAGALDVALAPIQMEKHRPGEALTVIAPLTTKEGMLARLFADSTTLGARCTEVDRVTARRWPETIETAFGPLEVKVMAVKESVEPGSLVRTDGRGGYGRLPAEAYAHTIVRKSADVGENLLPLVNRGASLLKRWLLGTHQGAVRPSHLDYYLDEFTFLFNRRKSCSRGKLFSRLVQHGVSIAPVSGDEIRGGKPL